MRRTTLAVRSPPARWVSIHTGHAYIEPARTRCPPRAAFADPDGRTTANLLNISTSPVRVALRRGPASSDVYVTDEKRSLARVPVAGDLILDPRSLTTLVSR